MHAAQAINSVSDLVRSPGLDYPTAELQADRIEAGWNVFAPLEVDGSDPTAFLDMPVGRSFCLLGATALFGPDRPLEGREVRERFIAQKAAPQHSDSASMSQNSWPNSSGKSAGSP